MDAGSFVLNSVLINNIIIINPSHPQVCYLRQSYPILQSISLFLSAFKNDHGPQMLYIFFVFLPFPCMCTQYPILELLKSWLAGDLIFNFPATALSAAPCMLPSLISVPRDGIPSRSSHGCGGRNTPSRIFVEFRPTSAPT
jgi:hypothetical protein